MIEHPQEKDHIVPAVELMNLKIINDDFRRDIPLASELNIFGIGWLIGVDGADPGRLQRAVPQL